MRFWVFMSLAAVALSGCSAKEPEKIEAAPEKKPAKKAAKKATE